MKHLYNKIKPVGYRAIVLIDTQEKNSHRITGENGQEIDLYIDTSYSWDSRITKPTQGTLITDFKNLKAGTHVLLHHNAVYEDNLLDYDGLPNKYKIHAIEANLLYFGIDGEDIICVDGYMAAERIFDEDLVSPGGIILTEKKKQDSYLKIIAKPDSIDDFEVGDIAVVYKKSDYEMTHNVGGRIQNIIRLKYSDCVGKDETRR